MKCRDCGRQLPKARHGHRPRCRRCRRVLAAVRLANVPLAKPYKGQKMALVRVM
jgi:DNA-directed RNA polymerase subunit RPC12/RpoP